MFRLRGRPLLRLVDWLTSWWLYKLLRRLFCWVSCLLFDQRPVYEPHRWNDPYTPGVSYGHQYKNNCYNYACNKATDTFAQPGYAHGAQYVALDCPSVTAGAHADGLTSRADGTPAEGNCCHTVALVMAPGDDYHWYRLDANGMWSHKPGGTPARNTDSSNNVIADPRTADRGVYTQFCGFFTVCRCNIEIDGPF